MLGPGPQGGDAAVFVGLDAGWGLKGQDLAALGHGLLDLLGQGGHVLHPAAIDTGNALRPQAQSGAGGIHRHVAAAHHADLFAGEVGGLALADAPQQLHGADHVFGCLALQAQLFVVVGADGDIHRIKAALDIRHGQIFSDGHAGVDGDAGGQDIVDVPVQYLLGQAIVGDAIAQHAAQLGPLLVHRDLVPHQGQVIGGRQTAGAAADDGHRLARLRGLFRHGGVLPVVHGKALQPADIHRVVHHTAAALGLAGVFAHIGAGGGEGVVLADEPHRVAVTALPHQGHIAGYIHMGRADGHTGDGVAQGADAPAVKSVLLKILPEAPHALEHHVGGLVPDGAVGGIGNDPGGGFDEIDGLFGGGAVQHLLDEVGQLAQSHPAGYALSTGLCMTKAQKIQ